jgi:hypothetical protein
MLDYVDLSIPYTKELDKIWNIGSSYIIHADIPARENATFKIHFLHDAPDWHHYRQLGEASMSMEIQNNFSVGATIMKISVHLENNTIDFSTYFVNIAIMFLIKAINSLRVKNGVIIMVNA